MQKKHKSYTYSDEMQRNKSLTIPVEKLHRMFFVFQSAEKAAVKYTLLESLNDLSVKELKKFKWFLQFAYFQKSLPQMSWSQLLMTVRRELLVDLMMENQQSVEVTKEVFMDMNRTDLVQRLSEGSGCQVEMNSRPEGQ